MGTIGPGEADDDHLPNAKQIGDPSRRRDSHGSVNFALCRVFDPNRGTADRLERNLQSVLALRELALPRIVLLVVMALSVVLIDYHGDSNYGPIYGKSSTSRFD